MSQYNYDFDLIVTSYKKKKELNSFLKSVLTQSPDLKIRVIIINQNENSIFNKNLSDYKGLKNIKLIEIMASKISLSKARNIGLRYGLNSKFVAFPDDDCWYDTNTLKLIKSYFEKNINVDVISTCVWDPIENSSLGARKKNILKNISFVNLFKYPISVGLFFKSQIFIDNELLFNENYGAGTTLGSGEETELLGKILLLNKKIIYNGFIKVFHLIEKEPIDIEKTYLYSYGFGFLITEMFFRYKKIVLLNLIDVLLKTLLGLIMSIHRKPFREKYFFRIKGIFEGILGFMVNK